MNEKNIPINLVVEGMITSIDIKNESGQILASKGTRLTLNEINWFKNLGIKTLSIQELSSEKTQTVIKDNPNIIKLKKKYNVLTNEELVLRISEHIIEQFASPKSGLMKKIMDECIRCYIEKMGITHGS